MVNGLVALYQCRLFLLVQALIFGGRANFLGGCSGRSVLCLEVWADFCLAVLVPTIVCLGILVATSATMGLLLGPVRLPQLNFWMSF